jgi:hypothetical protein
MVIEKWLGLIHQWAQQNSTCPADKEGAYQARVALVGSHADQPATQGNLSMWVHSYLPELQRAYTSLDFGPTIHLLNLQADCVGKVQKEISHMVQEVMAKVR